MNKDFPLNFSAASKNHLGLVSRAKRRLMLGLTARHIRAHGGSVGEFSAASVGLGSLFGSTLLDRLQPTLTRYHD
jgi:hypothetical protein